MVAPRTLQAIAADGIFPEGMSAWLKKGRGRSKSPCGRPWPHASLRSRLC